MPRPYQCTGCAENRSFDVENRVYVSPVTIARVDRGPAQEEMNMASPRPRPQVIRLTDAAAERIKYVMANAAKPVVGVRVGVKNGGCAGMTYTMEYADAV